MKRSLALLCCCVAWPAVAKEAVDLDAINRIVDEAMNRSELPELAAYLCDRIGGRLTNSPQMRLAESWSQETLRGWGLQNARAEGFEFGRGWSIEESKVRMLTPRAEVLRAIPVAWTPPTPGTLRAPIVVAPLKTKDDFSKWQGKLRGKIVLVSQPTPGSEPDRVPFRRLSDADLAALDVYQPPVSSPSKTGQLMDRALFEARRDAFLASEGAVAWVSEAWRDGGRVHGEGYGYKRDATPKLPGIEMAAEDYRKLARLARTDAVPTLEISNAVRYHDEDSKAYNIIADIPGSDRSAGYVMAGAHLDSWVASDGAQDNGAGSVIVMEAARILHKLNFKPKRGIRFVLWNGEEQGMLGSAAYVERYLASRPPIEDAELARVEPFYTWTLRYPIARQRGYDSLAGYFNIDNGAGKIRGIYAENNFAAIPVFREWLAPFASMGATKVVVKRTGGTDHVFMQDVGLPGFQFVQDPLDYSSRTHHSDVDSYDHLKLPDMKQATAVLASMLLMAAQRDEPLPRLPLPTPSKVTDPFEYADDYGK